MNLPFPKDMLRNLAHATSPASSSSAVTRTASVTRGGLDR